MARVTIEDCIEKIPNRFELVQVAVRRSKQIFKGAPSLVDSDNKAPIQALREVAAGRVIAIESPAGEDEGAL